MSRKTMIIGANGALGTDLCRLLENTVAATHADFDICNKAAVEAAIRTTGVQSVVNTAAFHQVPLCETEWAKAFAVNVMGVRNLAEVCAEQGVHLCHISTDYVFDGTKGAPYVETDLPAPLSMYAISKLAGEHAAVAYGNDVSIVRSCGLYGEVPTRAKGGNFINTMIKLGSEREKVTVVDDEIVCPTYTHDLAVAIGHLLDKSGRGIFHISNTGETTWFQFAKMIFEHHQLPAKIEPTTAASFQSVVQRPAYSILNNAKFEQLTGHQMPTWQDALQRHLTNDTQAPD